MSAAQGSARAVDRGAADADPLEDFDVPDADRRVPRWAAPLAPLPEWLQSVDALVSEQRARRQGAQPLPEPRPPDAPARHRHAATRHGSAPARIDPRRRAHLANLRAIQMTHWRRDLRLGRRAIAELLGYAGPREILEIERRNPVRRPRSRQRRLVAQRCPEALAGRSRWLRQWRHRLGFSQREAAAILGYRHRLGFANAEFGSSRPSWEKLLIAIELERRERGAADREPKSRA